MSIPSSQSFNGNYHQIDQKSKIHKRTPVPSVHLKNPCVIMVIRNQLSYLIFEYESKFVTDLSKNKQDLQICWSKENRRWEFATENLSKINEFLFSSNIEFLQDDRRPKAKIDPRVLLVIGYNQTNVVFEYESNLVKLVSARKKELKLFWNVDKKRWQVSTQNLQSVVKMLNEKNLIVITDDRRA